MKKSIYRLSENVTQLVRSNFVSFKGGPAELNQSYKQFVDTNFYTEKGSNRYPNKYKLTCEMLRYELVKLFESMYLIYCYKIDGELYTTYKNSNNSHFVGTTDIKNYRSAGKEDRLIELRKSNEPIEHGFYYPCGKPYRALAQRG